MLVEDPIDFSKETITEHTIMDGANDIRSYRFHEEKTEISGEAEIPSPQI